MSANPFMHPDKTHTLTDDLEPFLHVLGWTTLRLLPAIDTYDGHERVGDMQPFDKYYKPHGGSDKGGRGKRTLLLSGEYPSSTFRPQDSTPFNLLRELKKPFKSFYAEDPPTAKERKKVDVPLDHFNEELYFLRDTISQYDNDMKRLRTSTWFIATMKTSLTGEGWPKADKANNKLPIHYGGTRVRDQNMAGRRQRTQNLWEDSKGLRSSSKRAASPTPERSAKRLAWYPRCVWNWDLICLG